jgi:hypothetical protein
MIITRTREPPVGYTKKGETTDAKGMERPEDLVERHSAKHHGNGKGYRLIYQNPNHPPARERLKAMVVRAATFKGAIGAIAVPLVVAVLAAAIIKWLGLT